MGSASLLVRARAAPSGELIRQRVDRILAHMVPFTRRGLALPPSCAQFMPLLESRIRSIFEVITRERDTYALLFKEALAKAAGTEDLVRELDAAMLAMIAEEIQAAADAGHIDAVNAPFVEPALFGMPPS